MYHLIMSCCWTCMIGACHIPGACPVFTTSLDKLLYSVSLLFSCRRTPCHILGPRIALAVHSVRVYSVSWRCHYRIGSCHILDARIALAVVKENPYLTGCFCERLYWATRVQRSALERSRFCYISGAWMSSSSTQTLKAFQKILHRLLS